MCPFESVKSDSEAEGRVVQADLVDPPRLDQKPVAGQAAMSALTKRDVPIESPRTRSG